MSVVEQQQAILAAASRLLAEGGPQALRVRDIADAAGCTTMAVYSRFGGKEGIIEAIYTNGFTSFGAALRDELVDPVDDQTYRMGMTYREWALANPGAYRIMFSEAVPGFTPSDQAVEIASSAFEALISAIENSQRVGLVRSGDSTEVAWGLWGIAHGLVMLELAGPTRPDGGGDLTQRYSAALHATFRGFGP